MSQNMIKIKWLPESQARDSQGSAWVKVFGDPSELPELLTLPTHVKGSEVKSFLEARYGYEISSWSYWSAVADARRLANLTYSSDPM